jgi:hypothetical protein
MAQIAVEPSVPGGLVSQTSAMSRAVAVADERLSSAALAFCDAQHFQVDWVGHRGSLEPRARVDWRLSKSDSLAGEASSPNDLRTSFSREV